MVLHTRQKDREKNSITGVSLEKILGPTKHFSLSPTEAPTVHTVIALYTNDVTDFWSLLCRHADIKPDQYKRFVWESHVRQQIFVVFEDFYR